MQSQFWDEVFGVKNEKLLLKSWLNITLLLCLNLILYKLSKLSRLSIQCQQFPPDVQMYPFGANGLSSILHTAEFSEKAQAKGQGPLSTNYCFFCSVLLTLKFIPFTLLKTGLFNFIMYSHPYNDSVPWLVHLFTKPTFLEGYTWMLGLDNLINTHCPVLTLSQYCVIN